MAWRWPIALTSTVFLASLYSSCLAGSCAAAVTKAKQRDFVILNDTFIKDGQQLQVISGRCVASYMHCLRQMLTVDRSSFLKRLLWLFP